MKITVRGIMLNYETIGEGQPVICIHGWNENNRVFKSLIYRRLLKECKIYAIDLPGFGKSQCLIDYDFKGLTDIVDEFANALGLNNFILVGQCMGGIIALDYAIRHSHKVSKLILVETMIYFPIWMNLLLFEFFSLRLLKLMLRRKIGFKLLSVHRVFRKSGRNKKLAGMFEKVDVKNSIKYIRLMKDYSRYDHIERAKILGDIPVVLITAGTTFKQVRKTSKDLKNTLNNVSIMHFSDKNHFVYI
ncbi:alpha/beta hydrolase [Pseudobacteroides cellulosolvens]|uniref:AB hydrolase-1 domain-containing protein n=1 Tax=Pseudobacteroides cellulosolvens ATCC 35603 = DSM 2933 TaxID=398512 RepID=A0A0L6JL64_9FIRM|nr:alpha/beta hydrolase [Pseudobacteroides cellulosolvens]KNY26519.1 hypothetical protein Bccel_1784 [Pseudobacteroides cellulosolvens ATCC 35603 = DSM 2933]